MALARDIALVAVGGAAGCVLRFLVSTYMPRLEFPWHTLVVNLAGSFLLGLLFLEHGMDHSTRLLVAVGFFGGFTTLSTFSVETIDLAKSGHSMMALANMVANGVGGPLLAFAGWRIAVLAA